MKKRWKIVLLCLALAGGTGCSGKAAEEEKVFRIGVSVYDSYDTFISSIMDAFRETLNEDQDFQVEIHDSQQNQLTQNEQVKEMISSGCDVICVNLVDRTAPKKIIDVAKQADVPIIFFNRELVEEDLLTWTKLYYVGARARQSGQMEGEEASEACREPGADRNGDGSIQYVVLEGEAGHQDTTVRTEVSTSTLEENGIHLEKLTAVICNWNRREAQTKMNQLLKEYGTSIELLLANNDDMALGAIDALEEKKVPREQWPIILGIDGTEVGLEAIQEGKMYGSVFNDAKGQAEAMAELAARLVKGMELEPLHMESGKYIFLPYQPVTQQNVQDYLED